MSKLEVAVLKLIRNTKLGAVSCQKHSLFVSQNYDLILILVIRNIKLGAVSCQKHFLFVPQNYELVLILVIRNTKLGRVSCQKFFCFSSLTKLREHHITLPTHMKFCFPDLVTQTKKIKKNILSLSLMTN